MTDGDEKLTCVRRDAELKRQLNLLPIITQHQAACLLNVALGDYMAFHGKPPRRKQSLLRVEEPYVGQFRAWVAASRPELAAMVKSAFSRRDGDPYRARVDELYRSRAY